MDPAIPSILIVQPWLNYRGAETLSMQLAEDLIKRGAKCNLLCLFVSGHLSDVDAGYVIKPYSYLSGLLKNRVLFILFGFWVMLFYLFLHGKDYDIYNPHNFPSVWACSIVAFFYRKKVVWTVHNFPQHPFIGFSAALFEFFTRPFDIFFVKRVNNIVCVSQKVRRQVAVKYSMDSSVIYPGIDFAFLERNLNRFSEFFENNLKGKRIVLTVGQIRVEKNPQLSVDIFHNVAEKCPDLVLVFVGEGDRNAIFIDEKIKGRVYFTGTVSRSELARYYATAEFVLQTSRDFEGCSLVVLEALIGAAHLIVCKDSGADEILEKENIGCVFSSLESASSYVAECYDRKEKEKYGDVLKGYDRSVFAQEYRDVFIKLI